LDRRLVWTQARGKIPILPGMEPRSSSLFSDTILTELPQLRILLTYVLKSTRDKDTDFSNAEHERLKQWNEK
jgi:hypothetical protein